MMTLKLHFKNVAEEKKDAMTKLAEAKLEDLGHFFPKDLSEDMLQSHCDIEESSKTPFYTVHTRITIKQGKEIHYEATEKHDHFETALNMVKDTIRNQIAQRK